MKNLFYFVIIFLIIPSQFANAQNNALEFDGVNDYLDCGVMNLSFQSFAIEGWFKADVLPSAGNYPHIFGIAEIGSDAAIVRINGDTKQLEFVMNSGAGLKWVTSPETIQAGIWYHAAILYHMGGTNDSQYLLINGEVVASATYAHVNNFSNQSFRIGGNGNRNFDGYVDDVKVWSNFYQSSQGVRDYMYKEAVGNETNLVAYYKLDENSGTTANDSQTSSNYDGTLTNMTGNEWTTSSAFFGPKNCLNFDGLNANVWCPNITPIVTSGSIEFWVNLDVIPADNARLISRHTEYGYDEIYLIANDGRIATTGSFVVGDDLVSTAPLPLDVWTHVAIIADGSGSKLYINGILDDTGGVADFYFNTFRFGGQFTAGYYEGIDGMMDEVRLWNVVRTESEIRENMYQSLVGDESGLVAYFNLDNTYGAVAQSYPAEANDGSIGGGVTWLSSTAFNTWLNTDNSDWSTASNWSNGVPGSTDNIGIYNLSGNNPSVTTVANCNDLYLESGASMSLNDGASFLNTGNLYINGDFIYNKTLTNDGKWHIISAPNSSTTANLFFGDYLQNWNESTGLWEQIDDENTTLTPVKGYGFYGTHTKASYSFTGVPNDGDQIISLTTSGSGGSFNKANAVGNPYPSSIDWDLVSGYGAKYTWNGTAYVAYPATGGFGLGSR
ncbi:LamG domain-containing protein, partial [Lentimicrobium sp. S6]|uniref:LamG domain-containing protein n=1 Tax=Lentimicrobium sp. S6 TaxID=2735872 RepID=UPI001551DBE1